jgi:REP element-mobilizing transposase RayT
MGMSRGDRREPIFKDDGDRELFLATLAECCAKTDWQVHALCLMPNHFHLVIETPKADLVAGMKWLLGTYRSRFNRRHKLVGHLFSGRYKSLIVDRSVNAVATREHHDVEMDSASASVQLSGGSQKKAMVSIVRTDPFSDPFSFLTLDSPTSTPTPNEKRIALTGARPPVTSE